MRFTEEQEQLREVARDFAENEMRPRIREFVENEGFMPRDLYKRLGELGFCGIMVPEEYGGAGKGMTELIIITEELSKVAPTMGLALMCVAPSMVPMSELPAFRENFLPGILSGDVVFDGAVTDPSGHTNIPEWPIMATTVEGGYLLNGTKQFVTCAAGVNLQEVYALDENRDMKRFLVQGDAEGFNHNAHEIKFGMKGSGGGTCTYQDVFVPKDWTIPTEVGGGVGYNWIWLQCATIGLGAMEGLFEKTADLLKSRTVNGVPLSQVQAVYESLALQYAKLQTCRSLVYDACEAYAVDDLDDAFMKSQVAKIVLPGVALEVTKECLKLFGGRGYADVETYHYLADAVSTAIMDLTTEYVEEELASTIGLRKAE